MKVLETLHMSTNTLEKLLLSFGIAAALLVVKLLTNALIRRHLEGAREAYLWRRSSLYIYTGFFLLLMGGIWIKGIGSITTLLGLAGAGLAIAMHDTIANIAGWFFIMSRKPFSVGDRIEIGGSSGDVIDLRLFQFSLVEIGNWVDADQSTGRIVHVPNSLVLREPLANYQIGFDYIWHEIPVLVTFESDWRKAKQLLEEIVEEKVGSLAKGAEEQIRQTAKRYLIVYQTLTPIVYTTVRDSGVLLTIRFLVSPRKRRGAEQRLWEAILDAFNAEPKIELAYPTTRIFPLAEK